MPSLQRSGIASVVGFFHVSTSIGLTIGITAVIRG